jgi:hypothetical protein
LELAAVGRNDTNFSQCSVKWRGFPWARGSRCHRVLILVDALFPLDGGRKREGEKKQQKKRREKSLWGRKVSLGLDTPCWLCHESQLLRAIKG